jgi:hypothetical protein
MKPPVTPKLSNVWSWLQSGISPLVNHTAEIRRHRPFHCLEKNALGCLLSEKAAMTEAG